MTGDAHLGEDLAQESFARVFAHRHQFQPDRKFSTWLWRIALNLCHQDARRMRIAEEIPDAQLDLPGPDAQLIDRERCALVRSALAALPEPLRVVVVLREYEGLKFREIAEVLSTPEGTVKSRMADALAQLSRQLKPIVDEANPRRASRVGALKERLM
jgi:RNA polymerase sigma-70 factor (ECF subfamily)